MRYNMNIKKFILPSAILLVMLFSIAAISAADLNDTDNVGEDTLKDGEIDEGSISDLYLEFLNADSSFDFTRDYKYDNLSDLGFEGGIVVSKKNFEINGNNHVIDCGNKTRAFNFTGTDAIIKDLIIKNAVYNSGSAIVTKSNLTLNNVTFINCSSVVNSPLDNNGAISASNVYLNINNCKFIDNSGNEGASITAYGSIVDVVNSTFISSSDRIIKGQIYLYKSDLTVSGSDFLNTTSRYSTAIFVEDKSSISISKSKFRNLFANKTAGAIAVKQVTSLDISNCEFYNVSSANNGGAIFADINGDNVNQMGIVLISNTKFDECYSGFGGAILQLAGSLIVTDSHFTDNSAEYEGGAIYTSYANVDISDSTFRNNTALDNISYGGACYFDKGDVNLNNNIFEDNVGLIVSTIYAYDTNLNLQKNYFDNPFNNMSIYSVYGTVNIDGNTFTNDNYSFNNTDHFFNYENTANPFIILNNTIYFDELPEKFDLREYGFVTPVKDQGFMGACWAFGHIAALESSLLRYTNQTYSLSVNNMQNTLLQYSKYGRVTAVEGGRYYSAISYLVDWLGIFPEEYDGYDELGKISSLYITPDDIHIQNVVVIPPRNNAQDNDLIKNALINYGAVAAVHRAEFDEDGIYYNPVYSAIYYNGKLSSDHMVCIVGWDDNFSRNNFNPNNRPPADGAWIVKNSWGTDWGDGGYFYVSYYDTSIANNPSVAYIINNDSYNRIYQHNVGGIGEWSETAKYYANKFIADEDELIAAVGTFFDGAGKNYEFSISVNNVEVYTQNGISKFGGYETIKLDKFVQIKKGDTFLIKFKNMLFYDRLLRIHVEKDQSFASSDGKTWKDLSTEDIVAILKAYTVSDINITKNLESYYNNETIFVAQVGPGEEVIFEFNGENATRIADVNGLANLTIDVDVGGYPITTYYNNISIVNYVLIKSTIVSSDVTRGYNSNYNYKLQLLDSSGNPLNKTAVPIAINGKFKNYTCDESGYITLPFTKLTKQQTITVVNPVTGDNRLTKIVVKSRFSGASNVAMYYFDGSKFKARIVGDDGNFVGKNQVVTIKLNKKTYKVKTDSKGYVTLKIPNTLKPKSYKLTATYKGQTIKKTIKVKQNLKTNKYSVKKSAKKLVVKATLKNGKTALKNKKITLKIKGKKITAKTNKKGIAKFTIKKNIIKKLKAGKKYTMQVTYLKNTIKTTLKVKR